MSVRGSKLGASLWCIIASYVVSSTLPLGLEFLYSSAKLILTGSHSIFQCKRSRLFHRHGAACRIRSLYCHLIKVCSNGVEVAIDVSLLNRRAMIVHFLTRLIGPGEDS